MVRQAKRSILPFVFANMSGLAWSGCNGSDGAGLTADESNTELVRGPVGPKAVVDSWVESSPNGNAECWLASEDTCIRASHHPEADVCGFFVQDTLARSQMDVSQPGQERCEPGRTSLMARGEALGRTNLYRWLMGLSPVEEDSDSMPDVESCALMQSLAGSLAHEPPQSWTCWEAEGAAVAGRSNLSLGPSSPSKAVDGLMVDAGEYNAQTLGHRRWISRPSLAAVAFGFSAVESPATCMHLVSESRTTHGASGVAELVMWPAPGLIPFEMVHPNNLQGEVLRWSVMGEAVDFGSATVVLLRESIPGRVSADDSVVPITSGRLLAGVGDGLWFEPSVPLEVGVRYRVDVQGASVGDFRWRTQFVDCGLLVPDRCDPVLQDCPLPGTACYGQDVPRCMDSVTLDDSESCRFMNECEPGHTCVVWADGDSDCLPYCEADLDSEHSCSDICPQGDRELRNDDGWSMCQRPE